jgi:hypothetical protein
MCFSKRFFISTCFEVILHYLLEFVHFPWLFKLKSLSDSIAENSLYVNILWIIKHTTQSTAVLEGLNLVDDKMQHRRKILALIFLNWRLFLMEICRVRERMKICTCITYEDIAPSCTHINVDVLGALQTFPQCRGQIWLRFVYFNTNLLSHELTNFCHKYLFTLKPIRKWNYSAKYISTVADQLTTENTGWLFMGLLSSVNWGKKEVRKKERRQEWRKKRCPRWEMQLFCTTAISRVPCTELC